jgi:hypothetical protein
VHIHWRAKRMQLRLPDLSDDYFLFAIDSGNKYSQSVKGNTFFIHPGVYILSKKGGRMSYPPSFGEFYAPRPSISEPTVVHQPLPEASSGESFLLLSTIAGIDTADKISIEIRNSSNKWKTVPMQRLSGYEYKAEVPADIVTSGIISYRIMVRKGADTYTFPGGIKGNPYAWDEWRNESWQTFVATTDSPLELFNPTTDRSKIMLYNQDWRNNTVEYITADKPNQLVLKATMSKPDGKQFMGWQYYFTDKIRGRKEEFYSFTKLVVRARAPQNTTATIALITTGADAFATTLSLTSEWKVLIIPLNSLKRSSFLLLPRPYPGFLPLRFTSTGTAPLNIADAERLEITFGEGATTPLSIEVESIQLQK